MDGLSEKAPLLKTSPSSPGEHLRCPLGRRRDVSSYQSMAVHLHDEYTPVQHRQHDEYTPDQHRHDEYTPHQHRHDEYTPHQHRHDEYTPDRHRHHEYTPDQHRHLGHAPDQRHHRGHTLDQRRHAECSLDHHDHLHGHTPSPQPQHRPLSRQAFVPSGSARPAETAPPTDSDQVSDTLSQKSSEEHPGHGAGWTPRRVGTGSLGDGDGIVREDAEKASVDVPRGQKRRMTLLTLVTVFWASAGMFHDPLVTQYIYQVYTESVYGNASAGVHVSKHPCVNSTGGSSGVDTRDEQVQDKSADLLMRLDLVSGGISILVNVFLGSYSDFLGRRFVLLLCLSGHFLRNVTAPVIIYWNLGLSALYTGYVIDGLCGGSSGILLGMFLYTADITRTDHQRTLGMAVIEMAVGLASAATNLCAGWFIQEAGFFYTSLVASLLLLLSLMLVACLPETVKRERKRYLSPAEAVKRVFRIYGTQGHSDDRALLLLSLLAFLFYILTISVSKIRNLYLMDEPHCWSSIQIGTFLSAKDGISRVASVSLIALLQRCLSAPYLAIIGAVSKAGADVLMGLARSDLMLYMVTVVGMAQSVLSPSVRAMMSRTVPPDKQGAMFASLAVVESISFCLSPFAFLTIYKSTMHTMRGIAFFVCGGLLLFIVFIYLIYLCLIRSVVPEQTDPISVQDNNKSESQ